MKIGIDLDGVIFDSEKLYRVYCELYDMLELHRNSIIENRETKFQDRYNWTQNEINEFFKKYQIKILSEANFMPGAKEVLKMLKNDGHELIIITARGTINQNIISLTEKILKNNDMYIFDKYYWATENKDEICVKENLDLMIDDSDTKCGSISKAGIETIYLKDAPNYEIEQTENLVTLYNWGEIYRYICKKNIK